MGARQTRTRTVVVTRSRTGNTKPSNAKVKKTSKRCPTCGRYV